MGPNIFKKIAKMSLELLGLLLELLLLLLYAFYHVHMGMSPQNVEKRTFQQKCFIPMKH